MHPWPNHGEDYSTSESEFIFNTSPEEARKRMAGVHAEAMEGGLTGPAKNNDKIPAGMRMSYPSCVFQEIVTYMYPIHSTPGQSLLG